MKKLAYITLCIIFLTSGICSCSPKIVATHSSQMDTVKVAKTDSVFVRDSIFINTEKTIHEKGDTVFIESIRIEYRDRWRDKKIYDTLYCTSIETEIKTVEVEKKLSKMQKLRMRLGDAMIIVLLGAIGIFLIRRLR